MTSEQVRRLLILSNRLPIAIEGEHDGLRVRPSSGGLVTALAPVLRNRGGIWIGSPGLLDPGEMQALLEEASRLAGYALRSVLLTEGEHRNFYHGFSNEILWPLFHTLHTVCNFDPQYWTAYEQVNRKFAAAVHEHSQAGDYLWVHDYHLMLVARELRRRGAELPMGFFLHIPFPPVDVYRKLPWRREILEALLEFDLIGFQTIYSRRNFLQCLRALWGEATTSGRGPVLTLRAAGREVRVGYFPISIDYRQFAADAGTAEVGRRVEEVRGQFPGLTLVLGVDRLDYTKGIPYKINSFRAALARYPELHRRVTLLQVVVPSREDIPPYHGLKTEIDRLVGEVNGEFTESGWIPIHYRFQHLSRVELLALYRAAEIALITPLEDGMNLVAKEFCACSLEEDCVLVLSEFAGAAVQLQKGAVLVNPYNLHQVAEAVHRAYTMPLPERRARMRRLRRAIQEQDIFWWVDSYLRAAFQKDLGDYPQTVDTLQFERAE